MNPDVFEVPDSEKTALKIAYREAESICQDFELEIDTYQLKAVSKFSSPIVIAEREPDSSYFSAVEGEVGYTMTKKICFLYNRLVAIEGIDPDQTDGRMLSFAQEFIENHVKRWIMRTY